MATIIDNDELQAGIPAIPAAPSFAAAAIPTTPLPPIPVDDTPPFVPDPPAPTPAYSVPSIPATVQGEVPVLTQDTVTTQAYAAAVAAAKPVVVVPPPTKEELLAKVDKEIANRKEWIQNILTRYSMEMKEQSTKNKSCRHCHSIINKEYLKEPICPVCGESMLPAGEKEKFDKHTKALEALYTKRAQIEGEIV